jgi:hypothetical protein
LKNKEKKKLEFTLIIIQLNQKKQSVIEIHLSFVYIQKKTNNVFKKKKKKKTLDIFYHSTNDKFVYEDVYCEDFI